LGNCSILNLIIVIRVATHLQYWYLVKLGECESGVGKVVEMKKMVKVGEHVVQLSLRCSCGL